MKLRSVVAATSLAAAAILLPAIALAASSGTAAPAAAARCTRADLTAWMGVPGSGYAGGTAYQLEISNVSKHTCTLYGYPGVSALRSGHQLGSAAARTKTHPSATLTLKPGATVHSILQVANVGNYAPSACKPSTATALRVYAPNDTGSIVFPFALSACSKKGPVYLQVTSVIAGAGIPGYSN